MHTSGQLRSDSFAIELEGRPASIEMLVGFAPLPRWGCVSYGAVVGNLLLAAVTAFYDAQRARAEDFFIYPDYFLFHVGARSATTRCSMCGPRTRRWSCPTTPEAILEAINDRAITWLVVPDGEPAAAGQLTARRAPAPTSRIRGQGSALLADGPRRACTATS